MYVCSLKRYPMEKLEDILNKKMEGLRKLTFSYDAVYKFLSYDAVKNYVFTSGLRILPFELVEKHGAIILQDESLYNKYKDPQNDYFYRLWEKHYKAYLQGKIDLIDEYLSPIEAKDSPLMVQNRIFTRMKKIERRGILLNPRPITVDQKHTRVSGDVVEYTFARCYWVDVWGHKTRSVSRHIGNKYPEIEKEVGLLFHNRGFGVQYNYKAADGRIYDMVVERGSEKMVVEIKLYRKELEAFTNLFMFDELVRKFENGQNEQVEEV